MTPRTQMIIGEALIVLGFVAAWLQITQHHNVYSLVAVFLGAVGGQQIGQAHSRSKRK